MKIETPKIPNGLTTKNFHDIFYEEDSILEMCSINNCDFSNENLPEIRLYSSDIKKCQFAHTDFRVLK